MNLVLKILGGKFGAAVLGAVVGLVLAVIGGLWLCLHLETRRADGAEKSADLFRRSAEAWEAQSRGWEGSYRLNLALRLAEIAGARTAVSEAAKACDARVATARRSTAAIRSITQAEVPTDANRCPARPIVGADRLRDALGTAPAH